MKRWGKRLGYLLLSRVWVGRHHLWCRICRLQDWLTIRSYLRKWPKVCRACDGWGGQSYGGGYDYPPEFDVCEVLDPETLCHRCGEPGLSEEDSEGPCTFCGWNYDDGVPVFDGPCECEWVRDLEDWKPDEF